MYNNFKSGCCCWFPRKMDWEYTNPKPDKSVSELWPAHTLQPISGNIKTVSAAQVVHLHHILKGSLLKVFVGFPSGTAVKNLPANARDLGSIPRSGRSPGEDGNPFQYSYLGQRSQASYSPSGCKKSDMTEHTQAHKGIHRILFSLCNSLLPKIHRK